MITLMQKTIIENSLHACEAHLSFLLVESEAKADQKTMNAILSKKKEIDRLQKKLKRITKQYGNESFNALNNMKKNPLKEQRDLFG